MPYITRVASMKSQAISKQKRKRNGQGRAILDFEKNYNVNSNFI